MRRLHLSIVFLCIAFSLSAQTDSTLFMKQLCALDCVSEVKPLETTCFKEKYVLKMEQQVDWKTSAKGTFGERIFVGLKGLDKPTVIVTEGYSASYGLSPAYEEELSRLFDANVVLCEYRYFAESVPVPTNWDYMTVDNSLADYHHVRQVFGQLFKGKWISTGISKGGQTTMFYRATYPDDVDVSVSYVAPLNRAVEDGRHEKFLAKKVGTKDERKVIRQAMQELMRRKPELMKLFHTYCEEKNYHFLMPEEDIYDYCVLEFPFAFWQWGTPVSSMPKLTSDEDNETWFDYLMKVSSPDYFAYPSHYMPFDVQAAKELGYYGYSLKPIKKWTSLKSTKGYLKKMWLPDSLRKYDFDPTLYKRTVKYLKKEDPKHIFIYGEIDPWSSSGVCTWLNCNKKKNMRVYVQPRGSHRARISNMPERMKTDIINRLTNWLH